MENAVETLKIGFGVIVFAVALTVLFRMTSLIRETTEEVIISVDETTYIDYTVDTGNINTSTTDEKARGKRIVEFEDIIPTIFRYAQEGYGVTIIDGNDIVARFDLDTEAQVAQCIWDEGQFNKAREKPTVEGSTTEQSRERINKIKYNLTRYLKTNIFDTVQIENSNINTQAADSYKPETGFGKFSWLNSLITNIYGTGTTPSVYTGWINSNRYLNNYIAQRVNCDLYGGTTYFNTQFPGISSTGTGIENIGQHKAKYSNGLLGEYKSSKFTEYIIEIDTQNEYIEDTDLLVFGKVRYTKKRELIYVKNS